MRTLQQSFFFFLFLIYIKCSTIPTHHFFQEIIPSFFWRAVSPSIDILQETCSGHLGTLAGTSSSQASGVRCSLNLRGPPESRKTGSRQRPRPVHVCLETEQLAAASPPLRVPPAFTQARQPRSPSLGPVARTQSKRASLLPPASRVQEV